MVSFHSAASASGTSAFIAQVRFSCSAQVVEASQLSIQSAQRRTHCRHLVTTRTHFLAVPMAASHCLAPVAPSRTLQTWPTAPDGMMRGASVSLTASYSVPTLTSMKGSVVSSFLAQRCQTACRHRPYFPASCRPRPCRCGRLSSRTLLHCGLQTHMQSHH